MNIGFSTRSDDEKASAAQKKLIAESFLADARETVSGSSLLRIYLISLV